jgi:hypothetical protein
MTGAAKWGNTRYPDSQVRHAESRPRLEKVHNISACRHGIHRRLTTHLKNSTLESIPRDSFMLRSLAILCAIAAVLCLAFWIIDATTGTQFRFGWLLFSSILWGCVFEIAHRYFKRKGRAKTSP